jgi:hypothetical protein
MSIKVRVSDKVQEQSSRYNLQLDNLVRSIRLFLDNRISVDDFGGGVLVTFGDTAYETGKASARELASLVLEQVRRLDLGQIDEKILRQELAKAIQPFSDRCLECD